jgi:hypothetical protein
MPSSTRIDADRLAGIERQRSMVGLFSEVAVEVQPKAPAVLFTYDDDGGRMDGS